MTRPTTYLVRVLLFLLAVGGVTALLSSTLYQAFCNNPYLDGLIVGILLLGIGWNITMILRLVPEVRWVNILRHPRDGLTTPPPPRLLAPMASMLATHEKGRRLTLSAPVMQSLLDSLSARLDEGRELSRYLTGLLIFLGLLGTFYGLLLTVGSIADVIGNMSVGSGDMNVMFDQLKSGLAGPLHGMGTAFSGSMFGLAGALVLGFLDLTAGQAQTRFFNELEEWLASITRLSAGGLQVGGSDATVPAYVQALLEHTAENMDKLQVLLSRSEETRAQEHRLLTALNDRLVQMTDRSGEDHLQGIESLLARLVQESATGREQMVTDIRNDLRLLARTIAASAPGKNPSAS